MKAVVCRRYGPPEVLRLQQVAEPVPRADEVLVRIRATAVTASDLFIRSARVPWRLWLPLRLAIGLTGPRRAIIGLVLAGEVEAMGRRARRFRPGDRVYGLTGYSLGAYAQYTCLRETDSTHGCLAHMPDNLGFEAATAAAYGGLLSLQFLEGGEIGPGRRVLVYGASGTCGTMAVQLAKQRGAHVTGVCGAAHLELVRSLGADAVLDYGSRDAPDPGERFDFMLDAVGKARASRLKEACRRALAPGGRHASIDDRPLQLDSGRLAALTALIAAGQVRPVVDRSFPLERIAEAHAYVEAGHKLGGVAITV